MTQRSKCGDVNATSIIMTWQVLLTEVTAVRAPGLGGRIRAFASVLTIASKFG